MKLPFNIALLLISLGSFAQEITESPYSVPVDSANSKRQYIPTGIRLGADILGPALQLFDERKLSYEFTAEVDISNYLLVFETGYQEFAERNDNVDYAMNGNFSRIGPAVNFLSRDKDLNSFTFGLRYAWASFNETVTGSVEEDNWGAVPVDFDIRNNTSRWFEMTTGVKVRLWKGLFAGYIFRFRFGRGGSVPEVPFEPYFVPGYGLAARTSTWGFRYYVLYRFQWLKKPVKVKTKG